MGSIIFFSSWYIIFTGLCKALFLFYYLLFSWLRHTCDGSKVGLQEYFHQRNEWWVRTCSISPDLIQCCLPESCKSNYKVLVLLQRHVNKNCDKCNQWPQLLLTLCVPLRKIVSPFVPNSMIFLGAAGLSPGRPSTCSPCPPTSNRFPRFTAPL